MIIKKAEYLISAVKKTDYPQPIGWEFVFVGRSNVGKSSFINALLNRKQLARTSGKPGKTQALNFYNINDQFMFVDVPGYGYAAHLKTVRIGFGEMIDQYLLSRQNLKYVFLILDLRHKPSHDDQLMYQYLKHFDLKIVIIATKADKIGTTLVNTHVKAIRETLQLTKEEPVYPVSSFTKKGLEVVMKLIDEAVYGS